jgi:hypothetical protein
MNQWQRPALDGVVSYVIPGDRKTSARLPDTRHQVAVNKEHVVNVTDRKIRRLLAHGSEHTLPAGKPLTLLGSMRHPAHG